MAFTTPLLGEAVSGNNTGEYKGYQVWVKGNGRVQLQKDGQTWLYHDYIDAIYWIDQVEGTPPVEAPAPTLTSLDPTTAELGAPDVTLHCHGSGFTAESLIIFADQDEPIEFISDSEITTIITLSLPWGAVTVPVKVRNADGQESAALDFTFTEAAPEARKGRR